MKVAGISNIGLHRKRNEDQFLIDQTRQLFLVCDGMGGHKGGDVASLLAVQTMQESFHFEHPNDILPALLQAAAKANENIYNRGNADESLHEMGTTLTAAVLADEDIYIAHVGDSSLFLYREGNLTKITRDHTLAEQMIIDGLALSREGSYNHILTRAVGVESTVEIDLYQEKVKNGDWILMCTDGLTDLVTESEMIEYLKIANDPESTARDLVAAALDKGGFDNITLVLICI